MAQQQTIADFGLTRANLNVDIDGFSEALSHVLGPVNNANWVRRYVADPNNEDLEFDYTLNLPLQTLIITSVFLEDNSANRYTDMTQWQLIVDSWTAEASGEAAPDNTLRYLGCCSTINAAIVRAIKREFEDQVRQGNAEADQEAVTVGPDATFWRDNPFIRSSEHVATALRESSGQNVRIVSAHLIWIGHGQFGVAQDLSIVVEFGVVDAEGEGDGQQESSATTATKVSGGQDAAGAGNTSGAGTTVFNFRVVVTND